MRYLLCFGFGLIVGLAAMLAVVSANTPEPCCTQVAINTQRMERMDRDLTELKEWRIEHTEKTALPGLERIRVLERVVDTHDWIFRLVGGATILTLLAAGLRLIVRKGQSKAT
jgi:hypothetical protein